MRPTQINKVTISCEECGTTISCKIPTQLVKDFDCPVCGTSLFSKAHSALKAALGYNRALAELMECQQGCGVEFDT